MVYPVQYTPTLSIDSRNLNHHVHASCICNKLHSIMLPRYISTPPLASSVGTVFYKTGVSPVIILLTTAFAQRIAKARCKGLTLYRLSAGTMHLGPGGRYDRPHVRTVDRVRRFRFCYCTRRICPSFRAVKEFRTFPLSGGYHWPAEKPFPIRKPPQDSKRLGCFLLSGQGFAPWMPVQVFRLRCIK